jgi:hypothetical protein
MFGACRTAGGIVTFQFLGSVLPEHTGPLEQRIQLKAGFHLQQMAHLPSRELAGPVAVDGKRLKDSARNITGRLPDLVRHIIRQLNRDLYR